MVNPLNVHEHIGIKENIEIVKVLEIIYGLLCNLELVLVPGCFLYGLIVIENTLHTTLFLCIASITILFYELCIPLCFLGCAIKMLFILYNHEKFTPKSPDVKNNIFVMKCIAEFIIAYKYNVDHFTVEVIYWQNPKSSTKLVTSLVMASLGSLLLLNLISIRVIICCGLWIVVLYHS